MRTDTFKDMIEWKCKVGCKTDEYTTFTHWNCHVWHGTLERDNQEYIQIST